MTQALPLTVIDSAARMEEAEAPKIDDPLIGTVIAERYRVEARVGEGGKGSVYRVEHTHMRKRFALKVLHADLSNYEEVVARFEREAMAAANIEHPNIATATDFGKLSDGSFYLVLEYVEGSDLRQLLQRDHHLNPARAVHIALQILGALGRAHELGIVHRDLKPENVLLLEKDGDPEFVKILDFGIARVPIGSLGSEREGESNKPLTKAGTVYGTPEYMAPEQALGHIVDGRADLYAVGILLFEMLAGTRPFDDKDKIALLGAHVSKPVPKLSTRVPKDQFIPEALEATVTRLLAKNPADRFQTASEVADELLDQGFEAPLPITRHPSRGAQHDATSASRIKLHTDGEPISSREATTSVPSPSPSSSRAAPGPAPALVAAPPSAEVIAAMAPAAPKASKVPWFIAAISVAIAIGAVTMLRKAPRPTVAPTPVASTPAPVAEPSVSTSVVAPAASADLKEASLRALGRIASGEADAGIKELEALVALHPKDPVVLRAMAQGYGKAKRNVDAMGAMKTLATIAPDQAADPMMLPVFEDALSDPKAIDEALLVLTVPMGFTGEKILADFAFGDHGTPVARTRALRTLREPRVNKTLPIGYRAAIEVRAGTTCPAKKAALEKYRKDLDAEYGLPVLRALAAPTCGPNKKTDCWPCLGPLLPEIIKELEKKKQ
ncbi:MAG: protein kinase domain-containing protein [Polyangiales bacterium]